MAERPATLLVARHGDAEYGHPPVLSDEGGWLSTTGVEQVRALAEALTDRRVVAVCTSTLERARESGAIAADVLGVRTVAMIGLEEFSVGTLAGRRHTDPELASVFGAWLHGDLARKIPGGESGQAVVERYRAALGAIADEHRGATVLVFSHGGVMSFVLPRISGNVRDDLAAAKYLPNCAVAEVTVDPDRPDGFRVVSWPGSPDRSVV